ncbi:MAG: LL-diaminopimelate aminotransferase [Clostridia bacterium]|nr:LL-diaminopimelate aminotransferase [Clostridia bacterium]
MNLNIQINEHYFNLKKNYLFSEIAKRVSAYSAEHPDAKIVRLGIGDVTLPLAPVVVEAMKAAAEEMGNAATFRGYAPDFGYDFLLTAISNYYAQSGIALSTDEIFVSDGAKSDVGNIVDILGDNEILIPDPVYPVYLDSNVMSGHTVSFLKGTRENGFLPSPENLPLKPFVIYLCSPNNPTGAVYDRDGLKAWVDYANRSGSLIIFDSAYEAFIAGDYPHSIYEVEGARTCAVEICSFSKMAGFTGTRCAWTVFPKELMVGDTALASLWGRRQATKFNGVPYVVQRAAEAALSEEGQKQCRDNIAYYMENARILADLLTKKGVSFTGGTDSPYLWLTCPNGMKSWEFFDFLLNEAQLVGTPGAGFGEAGEGYFRLTSFGSRESTIEAVRRLEKVL